MPQNTLVYIKCISSLCYCYTFSLQQNLHRQSSHHVALSSTLADAGVHSAVRGRNHVRSSLFLPSSLSSLPSLSFSSLLPIPTLTLPFSISFLFPWALSFFPFSYSLLFSPVSLVCYSFKSRTRFFKQVLIWLPIHKTDNPGAALAEAGRGAWSPV